MKSARFGRHARSVLCPLVLALSACGAGAPVAVAEPRKNVAAEGPLVPFEIATDADYVRAIREFYTKYEYRIPMRDGVNLYTTVFVPKDETRKYPVMLQRTPYSLAPYGVENYPATNAPFALRRHAPSRLFVREGYILVHQDVRGRLMSEGTFVDVRPVLGDAAKPRDIDESTDAYDTIDWLVKNVPRNNGRVGVWGISYPGFYAAQAAIHAHPALKAVSPQAPVTDWFMGDDFHHHGAFFLADAFGFYSSFGKPRPEPTTKVTWGFDYGTGDIYDFFLAMGPLPNANAKYLDGKIPFWNELMAHGTLDAFWQARNPRPHYKDIKPAVMTVGGWFDSEDAFGALATYRSIETQRPKGQNTIVVGPWKHGGWARTDGDHLGNISFGAKTSMFYREKIEFPFFEAHLRDRPAPKMPEAWMFETGVNAWHAFPVWPPKEMKPTRMYFRAGGKLLTDAPAAPTDDGAALDAYLSDPRKPVPYVGHATGEIDSDYMTEDQRFASRRPDVLTYVSAVAKEDFTLAGPIEASLWVATTGTDADFIVKVIDVHPDNAIDADPNPRGVRMAGYQQLVRGEVMRGKFRESFERPLPFKPGEPAKVQFVLPDVFHTVRLGHRLMIQVQSTWFPLVDRNPQTFVDIYQAKESDFKAATHQLYRTPDRPSNLLLPVLSGRFPQ